MKIGYYIRKIVYRDSSGRLAMAGGAKVFLQHFTMLKELGFDTILMTRNLPKDLDLAEINLHEKPIIGKTEELADIPDCDIYVGTLFSDVGRLFRRKKGKVVHLCQGYESIDYISRIKGEVITEKYLRRGPLSIFRRYIDILKFKKRVKKIESIYALPTVKVAVSKHLVELIEKRYQQRCFLIQNGIDPSIFYPDERRTWGENGRIRILSVGSMEVGIKGIPDTLQSIKILKERGVKLEFIRVSHNPPSKREEVGEVVNQYYVNLSEKEMAELYRNTDIFISSSFEGEGFGLPTMEALASGVPSILTEISSYKNFDEKRDFAYFVPTHRPDRIAEGVLAFVKDRGLRERCQERGIDVAKGFTLERTKKDLLNFVQSLM